MKAAWRRMSAAVGTTPESTRLARLEKGIMAQEPAEETIPLVEEELSIGKRQVTTGRVRVQTRVEEVEEIARVDLHEDEVEVERVPIDRPIESAPAIRTEGEVTIIPIVEEVVVVEKRLVLKEELHVRRRRRTETVEIPVKLRKQRAVVDHLPPSENDRDD
jgi:uncharacterized protein (TIGR02271 family)